MSFGGETYDEARDGERLGAQLKDVFALMKDGEWHTLRVLAAHVGASEASVSARLRDLRKEKFGAHTVERDYIGYGLWQYRLILKEAA